MKEISVQALKGGLSAAIAEAASGRTLVVTRHGEPVARLTPAQPASVHRGRHVGQARLRPAIRRGTRGRYLAVLSDDRTDR